MLIKRKIYSLKSDSEYGHAYRGLLLGIVRVFTRNSEWNERCVVEKISQNYTKSCLTSIARIGLQDLQNGLGRKKRKSPRKKPKNTLSVQTPHTKRKLSFEC